MNIEVFNRTISINKTLMMSAASLACAVILGFSALVKIPIPGTPVPVTLQTFVLLAGAGLLGRYFALQMVGWYLLLGFLGAPFFANGSGWQYMCGATGGYIWGFFLTASIIGFFGKTKKSWISGVSPYIAAALALYVPGLLQLKLVTGSTWSQTLAMGFYPFIIGDLVKATAAFAGVRITRSRTTRHGAK